ncbi:MAG: protein kinase [Lachnospiraceae bacterium]|nr:protein kinase [Lachnospiraceae bacterium]
MNELDRYYFGQAYEVYEQIGKGGLGTIFRARHVSLQKDVVIKRVDVPGLRTRDNRREADILKNLRHSYLPQVFDLIEKDGVYYTVMDYIEGLSFQQLLDQGRIFTQQQAVKYGAELLEALNYLHTRRIPVLHGDIKPANIMLTPEDHICLIDFNISGYLSGREMMTVGFTSGYAAPEQIRAIRSRGMRGRSGSAGPVPVYKTAGTEEETELLPQQATGSAGTAELFRNGGTGDTTELLPQEAVLPESESVLIDNAAAGIDARADLYSVGAFLYHIVTGRKPSADPARNTPLSSYRGFSDAFAAIVDRAMSFEPSGRFDSAAQMLKALQGYGRADSRYKRMRLRHRLLFVALSAGIILCALIASMGYNRMRTERESAYEEKAAYLSEVRMSGDEEAFLLLYEEVMKERPETLDAQLQMALYLYETRRYEDAATYIYDTVNSGSIDYTQTENLGDLYFILGNCYYETGDYPRAVQEFRTAITYNDGNAPYYRDMALSLAITGNTTEAKTVLAQAEKAGLLEEQMALVRAEIASEEHRFEEAVSDFGYCIDHTEDDYVRMRAYVLWSEVYDNMEHSAEVLRQKAAVLDRALGELPAEQSAFILEKLIKTEMDLYEDFGEEESARKVIDYCQAMLRSGMETQATYNNLIIYHERLAQYEEALDYCNTMESRYPDSYETYKRRARLELRINSTRAEGERDYTLFYNYYDRAQELYREQVTQGRQDPEMQVLETEYQDVKNKGW